MTDSPLTKQNQIEIEALAKRYSDANGLMMKLVNLAAGKLESGLSVLPAGVKKQLDDVTKLALKASYEAAAWTNVDTGSRGIMSRAAGKLSGDQVHKAAAVATGAAGGLGGVGTTVVEIPVTISLIFRSVQNIAAQYGEDPSSTEVKLECIKVFGTGAISGDLDDIDTGFVGAKIIITGGAAEKLIASIAPKFAAMMTNKLAAQTVPVLGAITGAGINYAFVEYYQQMAHVRFGLRKVIRNSQAGLVHEHFRVAIESA